MKKIIIIIVVALGISTVAFGANINNWSLAQAFINAIENNKNIEIDQLELAINEKEYEVALCNAKYSAMNTYSGEMKKYITPYQKETAVEVQKRNNELQKQNIERQIISNTYNALVNEIALDSAEYKYMENVKILETEKNQSSSEIIILEAEYAMKNSEIYKNQAENNYQNSLVDLELLVGENNVIVTVPQDIDDLSDYLSPYDFEFHEILSNAKEKDITIYSKNRLLMEKEMTFDIIKKYYLADSTTYLNGELNVVKAQEQLDAYMISKEINIKNDINDLKTYYDTIVLEKININILYLKYTSALGQFEQGYVSQASYESALNNYNNARVSYLSKIKNYVLAYMQFEIDY